MARVEDVGAGARRAGAARRHIGDHRDRRGEDVLDDVAHGRAQAPRRVHAQDEDGGVQLPRLLEARMDELGRRRSDGPLHLEQDGDPRRLLGGENARRQPHAEDEAERPQRPEIPPRAPAASARASRRGH